MEPSQQKPQQNQDSQQQQTKQSFQESVIKKNKMQQKNQLNEIMEKSNIVFRLKRKASELPQDLLVLEQTSTMKLDNIQQQQMQGDQEELNYIQQLMKLNKKIKPNSMENLISNFSNKLIFTEKDDVIKQRLVLKLVDKQLTQDINKIIVHQRYMADEHRDNQRQKQLNRLRKLDKNIVNQPKQEQPQQVSVAPYGKEENDYEKEGSKSDEKDNKLLINLEINKEKKEVLLCNDQPVLRESLIDNPLKIIGNSIDQQIYEEDLYVIQQEIDQDGSLQMDKQGFLSIKVSKNLIPYIVQNENGKFVEYEDNVNQMEEYHDSEDENRSSNPQNTYPSDDDDEENNENDEDREYNAQYNNYSQDEDDEENEKKSIGQNDDDEQDDFGHNNQKWYSHKNNKCQWKVVDGKLKKLDDYSQKIIPEGKEKIKQTEKVENSKESKMMEEELFQKPNKFEVDFIEQMNKKKENEMKRKKVQDFEYENDF